MDLVTHRSDRSLSWELEELVIRPCRLSDRQSIAELAAEVFAADREAPVEQWLAEWNWKFNGAHLGETAASVAVIPKSESLTICLEFEFRFSF